MTQVLIKTDNRFKPVNDNSFTYKGKKYKLEDFRAMLVYNTSSPFSHWQASYPLTDKTGIVIRHNSTGDKIKIGSYYSKSEVK